MPRHIIVEGMDGSGKDTLISTLQSLFPFHLLHQRASTSLGGPVADLTNWTVLDVLTMSRQPPSIYNRHPLISEPIYATRRLVNPGLNPPWDNPEWLTTYSRLAAFHSVLVLCHPPFGVVSANLDKTPDGHMPGVSENRKELHDAYSTLVWPGRSMRYDYTKDTPEDVAAIIRRTLDWEEA